MAKMAKKTAIKRKLPKKWLLGCVGAALVGAFLIWNGSDHIGEVADKMKHYVGRADILTLETKLSPQAVLEARKNELLGSEKRSFQDPTTVYYPYLLLNVKYTEDHKSREGVLLWGHHNGEIVLNTDIWDTTHGFKDCLECDASDQDFEVIHALLRRNGLASLEDLQKDLKLEADVLLPQIKEAKKKHLIVQKGQLLQLHFENPRFLSIPQTKLKQQLVSKPIEPFQKIDKTYSRRQIVSLANAAFGKTFKIQKEQEIFLPVYQIQVVNPDDSIRTTEWNGLTGQQFVK